MMLRLFVILGSFLFTGCTYSPYHYSFSLVTPFDEELRYDDGDVSFQFVPTAESIWVAIHNKTDGTIYLTMNEAEFIDVWGISHRLLFGESYAMAMQEFLNNNYFVCSIQIDPGTLIEGNIWINIWTGSDIGDGWTTVTDAEIAYLDHDMLPTHTYSGKNTTLIDSLFYLVLPVHFDGYLRSYDFTFMIDDVEVVDSQ